MTSATAPGSDTVTACEASISTVVEPARAAMKRMESAGMARSWVVTMVHDGIVPPGRLGGAVLERGSGDRPLRGRHQVGDLRFDVGGEDLAEAVLLDVQIGAARVWHGVERGAELTSRELAGELRRALADVQVEAGDIHESRDAGGAVRGLGHDRAAVGVAGDHDGTGDAVQDAAQVGGVGLQAAERVRDGDDGVAAAVELGDHAVPAGRFGEGAVDEDDRGGRVGRGVHRGQPPLDDG